MKAENISFPCKNLRVLEAQFLLALAEAAYAEDFENRGEPITMEVRPARRRLMQGLDTLDRASFEDLVALVWFGRGDDESYVYLRKRVTFQEVPQYSGR